MNNAQRTAASKCSRFKLVFSRTSSHHKWKRASVQKVYLWDKISRFLLFTMNTLSIRWRHYRDRIGVWWLLDQFSLDMSLHILCRIHWEIDVRFRVKVMQHIRPKLRTRSHSTWRRLFSTWTQVLDLPFLIFTIANWCIKPPMSVIYIPWSSATSSNAGSTSKAIPAPSSLPAQTSMELKYNKHRKRLGWTLKLSATWTARHSKI